MAFFGGFLHALLTRPFVDTLILWLVKSIGVVHIWVKFHFCLFCASLVFNVQYHFRLLLGCFSTITPPNVGKYDGDIYQ